MAPKKEPTLVDRLRRHAHDLTHGGTNASELQQDLETAAERILAADAYYADTAKPEPTALRACADALHETPAELEDDEQPQRTLDIIARMLGWMNTPPRRIFEQEINALKSRACADALAPAPDMAMREELRMGHVRIDECAGTEHTKGQPLYDRISFVLQRASERFKTQDADLREQLEFQRARADKWVEVVIRRDVEIEELKQRLRADALAPSPADEEMVPHAFNSRTRYEPGDDRDIWCKDCEYHRDHAIHKEPR